jgi:uncharacterized hydrophobic protein (TIGR00271 family)
LTSVIALGSLAMTGLGIFLLVGRVLSFIGNQSALAYGLMVAFFLPVALVLGERASVTTASGGAFGLTKASKQVWLQFWTGWLLFGGYIVLGAIYAWIAGTVLNSLLFELLEFEIDQRLLIIAAVAIVGLLKIPGFSTRWRAKTVAIYIVILFVVGFAIRIGIAPVEGASYSGFLRSNDALGAIPFLALGLWGFSFILDHRNEMQRPRRNVTVALLLTLILAGAIGVLFSLILVNNYSGIVATSDRPFATIGEQIRPLTHILLELAALLIAILGLSQAMSSNNRLLAAMNRRGFTPEQIVFQNGRIQPYLMVILPVIVALLAVLLPIEQLAGTAASTLLLALGLVTGQEIFRRKTELPRYRRFRLPLHPLFPVSAALVCFSMAFAQRGQYQFMIGIWILFGIAYYIFYAREGAVAARQSGLVVTDKGFERERTANSILVYYSDDERAQALLALASNVARQRQRKILALKVLIQTEEHFDIAGTPEADKAWRTLKEQIEESGLSDGITIDPVVRLAPSLSEGIADTVWDEQVGTLILDRPADDSEGGGHTVQDVDYLVNRLPAEVIIFNGEISEPVRRVMVPMTSVGHGHAALALARDLAKQQDSQVEAMAIVHTRASPEAESRARDAIEEIVNKLDDRTNISVGVLQIIKQPDDYISAAASYDLVVLGSSEEGFLRLTTYSGFPADSINSMGGAGIVIKKRENSADFWLRQVWETLFRILPKLNRKDRAIVYRSMQTNARANIDFYTLIVLASGIAFLGLLLNSSSVIIGAMLIAPLMSPILAMATSIVMGNLNMMRAAANSTLNGIVMAVAVSAVLTLMLFAFGLSLVPTDEILSRTSPNMLDLLVALLSGAAAAYAVSRSQLAAALPGVAIAAALVPPLCVVGYGLGTGQLDIALGSGLLFTTNLAAIIVAAAAIFLLVGFRPPVRIERGQQARYGLSLALLALLAISIVLVFVSFFTSRNERTNATITAMIESAFPPETAIVLGVEIEQSGRLAIADFVVHDFSGSLSQSDIDKLQSDISSEVDADVILRSSIVNSSRAVSDGSPRPATATPTMELSPSPTETEEIAPSETPSLTPTGTATFTPTPEATRTITPTLTITTAPTDTPIVELSQTPGPTLSPTETEEPTVQPTETSPVAPTATEEPTVEATEEPIPTITETVNPTPEITPEPTS